MMQGKMLLCSNGMFKLIILKRILRECIASICKGIKKVISLKSATLIIVVSLLSLPLTPKKVEADWCTEIVDWEGAVGSSPSLALDNSGNPHISYQDRSNHDSFDLKYANRVGSDWQIGIVDSASDVWHTSSLALDASGSPRISYYDNNNIDLKYAWCESDCHMQDNWQSIKVDDADVWSVSLALDNNGNPHISYHDFSGGDDLKYAWCESDCHIQDNWQIVTVDEIGSVGWSTSLALDNSGNPHISYVDFTNSALKYASCESSCGNQINWQTVTIDPGDVSRYTSIAIDSNGKIHISYRYEANRNFIYACCESNCHIQDNWQIAPIPGCFGWYGSLAIDNNNNPHISYSEGGNLKYVYKFEDTWTVPQTVTCSNDDVNDTDFRRLNSL